MRIFERIVESLGAPGKHDLWVKRVDDGYSILINENDSWVPVGDGSGGDSGGGATAPIVVHGTTIARGSGNPSEFTPDDGQPTFSEAVEAFESGVPVMLVVDIEEGAGTVSANIVSYATVGNLAFLMAISEALIMWANVDSPDPDPDPEPDPDPDPDPDPEPDPHVA